MLTTKEIIDLCDHAGIEWRDYSGRGMYGNRCLGIVTDNAIRTVLDIVDTAHNQGAPYVGDGETDGGLQQDTDHEFVSDAIDSLQGAKTDSMGRSTIVYWEHLEVTDADLEGDDNE